MSKKYYIGVRASYSTMNSVLERSVSRLNQRMTESIRSAAMKKGIKKTEQGQRLELFPVTKSELDNLLDPAWMTFQTVATGESIRPLITVDADALADATQAVNNKYPRRMNTIEHRKYKADLAAALDSTVTVVGADKNTRKRTSQPAPNPLKVGDIIPCKRQGYNFGSYYSDIFEGYGDLKIIKSGKRFVEVALLTYDGQHWPNTSSAKRRFNNVKTTGNDSDTLYAGDMHGHVIPLADNPNHNWTWTPVPGKMSWDKVVDSYFKPSDLDDVEPALCYYYESCD